MRVSGVQFHAYHVCKTQLWFLSHQLSMEDSSEDVQLGKLLHEEHYPRQAKNIPLERVKLDFVSTLDGLEVWEIKKSPSLEYAHVWQLKYYLYLLSLQGIRVKRGVLAYPALRRAKSVYLTEEDIHLIEEKLTRIERIVEGPPPHPLWRPYCKGCSYALLCWS